MVLRGEFMDKTCGKKHLIAENYRCILSVDDKGYHKGFCLCCDDSNNFEEYDLFYTDQFCDEIIENPEKDKETCDDDIA